MFALMAWSVEVAPTHQAYAPTAPAPCGCRPDDLGCRDFRTHAEAEECLDYCWTQSRRDVHHLDSAGDDMACQPTPVPGAELAPLFIW